MNIHLYIIKKIGVTIINTASTLKYLHKINDGYNGWKWPLVRSVEQTDTKLH